MKDPFTGRDSLSSRTATDGSVHLNRGLRDAHNAHLQFERMRKQSEDMRKRSEDMRKQNENFREFMKRNTTGKPRVQTGRPDQRKTEGQSESKHTVMGSISDIQRQAVEGGTRTMFRLHLLGGEETRAETRLDLPFSDGDVVQVSGEVNSDLVLLATFVQKWETPDIPPEPSKIYVFRGILSAVLGDIMGGAGMLVLAKLRLINGSQNSQTWGVATVLGITFSAVLASLFAGKTRRANAALAGVLAGLLLLVLHSAVR